MQRHALTSPRPEGRQKGLEVVEGPPREVRGKSHSLVPRPVVITGLSQSTRRPPAGRMVAALGSQPRVAGAPLKGTFTTRARIASAARTAEPEWGDERRGSTSPVPGLSHGDPCGFRVASGPVPQLPRNDHANGGGQFVRLTAPEGVGRRRSFPRGSGWRCLARHGRSGPWAGEASLARPGRIQPPE